MDYDRNKVIQIARSEIGNLEKKTGDTKYLYDKTANAGNKNYTKYGGVNAHGWKPINHHWYYFDNTGLMMTGWQQINDKWYYLQDSGDYEGACWHESSVHDGSLEIWYVE